MPKHQQNPYMVSFSTSFGSQQEENLFFLHKELSEFLQAVKFSQKDIDYIIQELAMERTTDLCILTERDLSDLTELSETEKQRFTEIVEWSVQNKEKIAAFERLRDRIKNNFWRPL